MALYSYIKEVKAKQVKKRKRRVASIISLGCIGSGLIILIWVLYPILAFDLVYASKFEDLVRPMPEPVIRPALASEISEVLGTMTDYTKASAWFPKAVNLKLATSNSAYALSIPRFGINNAHVAVGGESLDNSLIHFTGPLPGNYGNPVIFGHSTLPFLYNPQNYKTIFTHLPDFDRGDDIYTTVDNVTFHYKVDSMKIVTPDDLAVLEQNYDSSYITLVTCVPPGTYIKRLVVKGKLVSQ